MTNDIKQTTKEVLSNYEKTFNDLAKHDKGSEGNFKDAEVELKVEDCGIKDPATHCRMPVCRSCEGKVADVIR